MPTAIDPRDVPTRGPARPAPYVVSGILLALGIVVPLIVPMYASIEPRLGGMPFFYWYQMLLVPIEAAAIGICYLLLTREDQRRRDVLKRDVSGHGPSATSHGGGDGR
ncbi:DUF3311 domain-containing protein [Pseudarthrobacter sp. S9]|uniref:DUF3311 domain-containing protein n=1 Tax=Pseudarthrobacter sp. S9 TaxID=3418421 RepID=UPI003D080602